MTLEHLPSPSPAPPVSSCLRLDPAAVFWRSLFPPCFFILHCLILSLPSFSFSFVRSVPHPVFLISKTGQWGPSSPLASLRSSESLPDSSPWLSIRQALSSWEQTLSTRASLMVWREPCASLSIHSNYRDLPLFFSFHTSFSLRASHLVYFQTMLSPFHRGLLPFLSLCCSVCWLTLSTLPLRFFPRFRVFKLISLAGLIGGTVWHKSIDGGVQAFTANTHKYDSSIAFKCICSDSSAPTLSMWVTVSHTESG